MPRARLAALDAAVLAVLVSSIASAAPLASPGGFLVVQQPLSTTVAHDGQGLELRDVSATAGASNSYQCIDTTNGQMLALGQPRRFQPPVTWPGPTVFAPRPGGFMAFGATIRGIDNGTSMPPDRMDVADFDCLTGFTNFRQVVVPTLRLPNGSRQPGCTTPDTTAVMTPDFHLFTVAPQAVCHWDPTTSTFTRELTPAELAPLLTPVATEALVDKFGETLPTTEWHANALVAPADGSLWAYVLLVHPGAAMQARHDFRFIVRRAANGTLSIVGGVSDGGRRVQPPVTPRLSWDPRNQRVLGEGYGGDVAVWDPTRPATAQFATLLGLTVPPTTQSDHVPLGPGARRVHLEIEARAFDGDLDGLPLATELVRSLDDTRADFDDDGALDGYEVNVSSTDPANPASPALTAAQRSTCTLGPSLQLDDWAFFVGDSPNGPVRGGEAARASDGALCSTVKFANRDACFEPDGSTRQPWPLPADARGGEFADQGACVYFERGDVAVVRRDTATGQETQVYTGNTNGFWPLSCATVFVRRLDNAIERLSNGESFVVADATRTCPLAGSPAELNDCEARFLDKPANFSGVFTVFGVDPDAKQLLVGVDTHRGPVLAGIDAQRAVRLVEVAALHREWPLMDVAVEAGGRRFALVGRASLNSMTDLIGVVALTNAWAPIATLDQPIAPWVASGTSRPRFFAGGLTGARLKPTYVVLDPPPASDGCSPCCACSGGLTVCQVCNYSEPPRTATWNVGGLGHWLPVEPGLSPGETLFAGVATDPLSTVVNSDRGWGLFRSAVSGAVVRFMDRAGVARLTDASTRTLLRAAPLADVTALGASPEALCFIDARGQADDDERAWVIGLDAARKPATVRLAKSGPYTGCAFDDDGTLTLLRRDGTLERGAASLGAPGSSAAFGLARASGRWLVQDGTAVRCLDDAGLEVGRAPGITGFAPGPHGFVHFTGNAGDVSWGGAATLADFCAGMRPTDFWFDPSKSLYDVADTDYRFSNYPVRTDLVRLAVRPDGAVLAAFGGVRAALPSLAGPYGGLWRIRPAWIPADPTGETRLVELDPLRRVKPLVGLHQVEATVSAIVAYPGGDAAAFAAGDWEYRGQGVPSPPTYPLEGQVPDAGDGSPGPTPVPTMPPSCGCTSASTLLWGLVLGWLRRARRKARVS